MVNKRCMILTTHFLPLIGGAQTVYDAVARHSHGRISILTAFRDYVDGSLVDGYEIFDSEVSYPISRLEALRPDFNQQAKVSFFSRVKSFGQSLWIKRQLIRELDNLERQMPQDVYCIGSLTSLGWMTKTIQKRFGKKVVLYIHGEEVSLKPYNHRADLWRKQALYAADHIIAVSEFTKNCLMNDHGIVPEKITVLTNGVDFKQYQTCTKSAGAISREDGFQILSVGRLIERKGFDNLIRAFHRVQKRCQGLKLDIVGEGEYRPFLMRLIDDLSLNDHVKLTGELSGPELAQKYVNADIFAMPNRTLQDGDTEGFGLVFLEAAAAKTAIIGGDAGGVPSAIKHSETGMLVDGADIDNIADTIIKLLDDPDLRAKLTENAHHYAQSQDWSVKADEFQAILQKVCQ
jgi:phosphatidylinositol alpha-1,6-mannosyltransferase